MLAVKSQLATPGKDGVAVNGTLLKAKNGIDLPLKVGVVWLLKAIKLFL